MSSEHVILMAFQIQAPDRERAMNWLGGTINDSDAAPDNKNLGTVCWWFAEDDRTDGSDNDSAVFVYPGAQRVAALALENMQLTGVCNIIPLDRSPGLFEEPEPQLARPVDGMMFQSDIAEALYANYTPTDVAEGINRCERFDLGWGSFVLQIGDGHVGCERLPAGHESMAWEEYVSKNFIGMEPEKGDYVIEHKGDELEITPLGRSFSVKAWSTMAEAIRQHMEENNFFPSIWLLSGQGNFTLITDLDDNPVD